MRYFLVSPESYPALATIPPASDLPKNAQGRLFFGASDAGIERMFTAAEFSSLLASGAVQELTRDEYAALCKQLTS